MSLLFLLLIITFSTSTPRTHYKRIHDFTYPAYPPGGLNPRDKKVHKPEVWNHGIQQLQGYLRAGVETRQGANRTHAYSIIAVGRRVKFFRYNYQDHVVEHWLTGKDDTPWITGREWNGLRIMLLLVNNR